MWYGQSIKLSSICQVFANEHLLTESFPQSGSYRAGKVHYVGNAINSPLSWFFCTLVRPYGPKWSSISLRSFADQLFSIQRKVGLIHCLMLIKKVTDVFWCFKGLLLLRSKGNGWPSDHASFVVFREEPIIRYWKYTRLLNAWSWEALQALIKDTCSQMGRARLTEDITKIFLVCSMGVVKAPQNSLNMNVIWHISWFLRHLADPKCGTLIG